MKTFTDYIDTPGGHIVVSLVVLLIGIVMWKLGAPLADQVITAGFVGTGYSMRGLGGKQQPALESQTANPLERK